MIQAKMRVNAPDEKTRHAQVLIPVHVPELDEICKLANELHGRNAEFDDEAWGWPVHYDPELPEPPVDSQLTFSPATFWIGVWPIWYVSFTWEDGRENAPKMLVGQHNVVK